MLNTEELLKPRYKVIADYPYTTFAIGYIINPSPKWTEKYLNNYPHIFKRLEWWEEREVRDMPEYVKGLKSFRRLLKVEYHTDEYPSFLTEGDTIWSPAWLFLPATKEEYLNQQ